MLNEVLYVGTVPPEKIGDIIGRAVPQTDPDHFGRSAIQHTQTTKVLIFGDEQGLAFPGKLPDRGVSSAPRAEAADVQRPRKHVLEQCAQALDSCSSKSRRTAFRRPGYPESGAPAQQRRPGTPERRHP